MADTSISNLTATSPATAAHRIPIAITPFGSGNNGYITPALILSYGTSAITGTTITATTALVGGTVAGTTGTFTGAMVGATSLALGASGGTTGTLLMKGTTSGTVTVQSAAAAGTWSMTLPTTAGTNAYVLQTDGTGITSWVAGGGGLSIGSAVSGGTAYAVLREDSAQNLAGDSSLLFGGAAAGTGLSVVAGTAVTSVNALTITQTTGASGDSAKALSITHTIGATASASTSIFLNQAGTSHTSSLLMDLQTAAVSKVYAGKRGNLTVAMLLTGTETFSAITAEHTNPSTSGDIHGVTSTWPTLTNLGGSSTHFRAITQGTTVFSVNRYGTITANQYLVVPGWQVVGTFAQGGSDSIIGFNSAVYTGISGAPDSAFSRLSAGVIAVGTGGAGSFAGSLKLTNLTINRAATFLSTSLALTNGAGASAGTITNAPAVGNPTKWIGIDDNGTTRYIPAW